MTTVAIASHFRPHEHQRRFIRDPSQFCIAVCGAQSGKTYGAAVKFVIRIFEDYIKAIAAGKKTDPNRPILHYWIVAPTYQLLAEPFKRLMEVLPEALIARTFKSSHKVVLKNGILIEGRSADDPLKLISVSLNGVWIDEMARVPAEAWYGGLSMRIGAQNGWMIGTTTPLGRNWAYEEYRRGVEGSESRNPTYKSFTWKTADNPYFSREYLENEKIRLPEAYYKREYEASFEAFSGLIFSEFKPANNVVTEKQFRLARNIPQSHELRSVFTDVICGVDFGWNDPFAAVVIGDVGNGQYVILEEFSRSEYTFFDPRLHSGTAISELIRLRNKWGVSKFVCDHRPENINIINNEVGFAVKANKKPNNLMPQLININSLLKLVDGTPNLHIFDDCKELVKEMNNYIWANQKSSTDLLDQPERRQDDHLIDATRYALTELLTDRPQSPANMLSVQKKRFRY